MTTHPRIYPSVCPSVFPSIHLSIHPPIRPSIYSSACLSVGLSVHSPIHHPSIHVHLCTEPLTWCALRLFAVQRSAVLSAGMWEQSERVALVLWECPVPWGARHVHQLL